MNMADMNIFESSKAAVRQALTMARGFNTTLDIMFYDVGSLLSDLWRLGYVVDVNGAGIPGPATPSSPTLKWIDLSPLSNPEGGILLISPTEAPPIREFSSVDEFLQKRPNDLKTVVIAGVGSSAFGAAAFGWEVATSLGEPVAAIIAGYGVADWMTEALGGYFGFGLREAMRVAIKSNLHVAAPALAEIGGSPEADVLLKLLQNDRGAIKRLIGHSKGCLNIYNALCRYKGADRPEKLKLVNFGCAVNERAIEKIADVDQYLGAFDPLGITNSWWNFPDYWLPSRHTTNPFMIGGMPVATIIKGMASSGPVKTPAYDRRYKI
jgi:hypothetical protein